MQPAGQPSPDMTRRRFLHSALAGGGLCLVPQLGHAGTAQTGPATGGPAVADDPEPPPLALPVGPPPRVVDVSSTHAVLSDGQIHGKLVGEMLDSALVSLTDAPNAPAAWRELLSPKDIVGIKFNRSGQRQLDTTPAVARALVGSLVAAGWPAERIVCIEAPPGLAGELGTTEPMSGYDAQTTDFGSGQDEFAAVLRQVTALIDVPFLKTHNIAGITCCLKNLSHGLVRHPARYHGDHCAPYIADIVASPAIRSKLRLCVVDALRCVYAGGPAAPADTTAATGALLAATDPVAADAAGFAQLNIVRKQYGLPPIAKSPEDVPCLEAAHRKGLGVALLRGIDLVRRTA